MMINPKIEEKTIYTAVFDIQDYEQAQEVFYHYEEILEKACIEQGLEKDINYDKNSKFLQPLQGVNAKNEPDDFISIMSIDYLQDSWVTHNTSSLPVQVIVNLEDWSDIKITSLSESIVLNPTIIYGKNNQKNAVFYIENITQAQELVSNFDDYLQKIVGKNPYITGAETVDDNGNIVKDVMLDCSNDAFEKILTNRQGNTIDRINIPLPTYLSIDVQNWNTIEFWDE